MNFLLILLMSLVSLCFGNVSSAVSSAAGFTPIPEAVRDIYSKEVMYQAQPRLRFLQFAKIKRDLTAVKGKSITFTKYDNLTGGGAINEDDAVNVASLVAADIQITVTEQANAITVTEYLLKTAMLDVLGDASKLLANNLAVTLDTQLRDAVLATTNIKYGNGAASSSAMTLGSTFNSVVVKDAVELLATNNAPKFEGEYYVCIAHPAQLRQMRDDANWVNANSYMGRKNLYTGEVGMYEGVIFIESTNMPKLSNAATITKYGGTYSPTYGYEAVIFGENAYAWAVALDVELRDDGVVDLGRKHTLGWYGIWGSGLIEGKNAVRILTAGA